MGAGTSHHTFWPEFPLEVRLPSPQCGEGKRISQRPAFSAPPHLRGGNGTNQPRTLPAPSASLCRTHRVRSAGSGEEASPARLPPTATPRSVWRTHAPGRASPGPARAHLFPFPGESQPSAAPAGTGRSSRGSPPSPASRRSAGEKGPQRAQAQASLGAGARCDLPRTSERLLCTAHGAWTRRPGGEGGSRTGSLCPQTPASRPRVAAEGPRHLVPCSQCHTLPASPGPWAPSCPARSNSG